MRSSAWNQFRHEFFGRRSFAAPTDRLRDAGHDAVHTLELPNKNRSTDEEICEISARKDRVVITKDSDFVNSFLTDHKPQKFLLISTGNITNADLEELIVSQIENISNAFETYDYLELTRFAIVVHV